LVVEPSFVTQVWANNRDFLQGNLATEAAAGAVILGVETADLKDFDQFLSNERFSTSADNNAWFDEYFQWLYQCHLPTGLLQVMLLLIPSNYNDLMHFTDLIYLF